MKKVLTVALLATFCTMAFGAIMVVAEEGMLTIDAPVTFTHAKHGEKLGCVTCHHAEPDLKAGATAAKSCFECHGPEAVDKQPDTYKMIHDKTVGKCLKCHKTDADAMAAGAPTKCKDCHK